MQSTTLSNARFRRALVAFALVASVVLLSFHSRATLERAAEQKVVALSALSWKVSETLFEAQRLEMRLLEYMSNRASREDLQLEFELFWSRIDVLAESQGRDHPELARITEDLGRFLVRHEHAILEAPHIGIHAAHDIRREVEGLTSDLRNIWIRDFLGDRRSIMAAARANIEDRQALIEITILLCMGLLSLYMVAELFGAQRAAIRERALREEAMAASAAKSAFLANVSHEIRTPLNGVMGMAQELAESPLTADQAQLVEVICASGEVLLSTINDVLDLSKVEAGRMELDETVFDPVARLEGWGALYAARAREKGLSLSVEIDAEMPERMRGDALRLGQVLTNLLSNAIKFTETGAVRLRAWARPDGAERWQLCVEVEDTGIGIPEAARARVFDPFTQAASHTARLYGGTGLGLSIARSICRLMEGDLTLRPRDGGGSVFRAEVVMGRHEECDSLGEAPVSAPGPDASGLDENMAASGGEAGAAPAAPVPGADAAAGTWRGEGAGAHGPGPGALRLLLVDDSPTNRLVLRRFLDKEPVHLEEAACGAEAVAKAEAGRFDLVLMDVQMPGMDGLEATRRIRAVEAARGDPPACVAFVTANVMTHQITEYRASGADHVLAKPVRKAEILALVRGLSNKKAA